MDEEWDDSGAVSTDNTVNNDYNNDTGRCFSKGRGFAAPSYGNDNGDDSWGASESNGTEWGRNDRGRGGRGRGPRGGGGGRGHRGGRGGRGGGGADGDGDSWSNTNFDDSEESQGANGYRGGRGGRGGGRGRGGGNDRGDRGGDNGDDNDRGDSDAPQKPREIYVPPEIEDASELFNSGNMSGINFSKYEDIAVNITGENCPPAVPSFEASGLRPMLLENIQKSNYNKPTPIQKHSIPIIMGGRDLMSCAQTGSGKTAAFLLPIINSLLEDKRDLVIESNHVEPWAVIVSPTRELTIQIYEQARKFAYGSIIKVVVTYGGTSVGSQISHLLRGCHILVATPGRMNDFVKRGLLNFSSIRFVVLDEADRMLDMGFMPAIEEMMNHETMVPSGERQTLMFSATFPEEIQHLAGKFLHDYIFIAIGIVGGACSDVEQVFHEVEKFKKRNKLLEILQNEGSERTLIFVETKRNADFLASYLCENSMSTTSIHGDRLQREREQALRDFKNGVHHILVATGVAARGLDIKNVKHVINFDLPKSIDEYVHRIGRTGRVGNRGKATSFFDGSEDHNISGSLSRILKQANQDVPPWLGSSSGHDGYQNNSFGGTDVRGDNFGQAQDYGANPTEDPDEDWS